MKKTEPSFQLDSTAVVQIQPGEDIDYTAVHKLAQPLTTISAYIWGCIYRLTNGNPEKEAILCVMKKVIQDIDYAQQIVLQMDNCINKEL